MNSELRPEGSSIRRQIEVRNRLGIHARPANLIARAAMRFSSRVEIVKGNECIDAKSIISLLTLGAEQGTMLEIVAEGDDAEEAVVAICDLFHRCFDEEEELTS
jgi:phosphotransferase system HPr (HPr) family protein